VVVKLILSSFRSAVPEETATDGTSRTDEAGEKLGENASRGVDACPFVLFIGREIEYL
jgi:hypothetical protein